MPLMTRWGPGSPGIPAIPSGALVELAVDGRRYAAVGTSDRSWVRWAHRGFSNRASIYNTVAAYGAENWGYVQCQQLAGNFYRR
jgi:hypothetical protein